jgi:dGTPase
VMDWADDVAYSVHDVEDGVAAGRIDLTRLADPDERDAVCAAAGPYSDESGADLRTVLDDLLALPAVTVSLGHPPGPTADAALKAMTSELTGRFSTGAIAQTRAVAGDGPLLRYRADLLVPRLLRAEVAVLKAVAGHYVMSDPARLRIQQREQDLLTELVLATAERGADALDPLFAGDFRDTADDAARLRIVLDQVSLLTDAQAVARHHRLTG